MFNMRGIALKNEPMWRHCTLHIGGPADYYCIPNDGDDLRRLLQIIRDQGMEFFVLGGGSNILVADRGIRGTVIDMRCFDTFSIDGETAYLGSGLEISEAAWALGNLSFAGLDFLFGMPGTVGGALWMNARCYGHEIADVLEEVDVMDAEGRLRRERFDRNEWDYKISPYQRGKHVIIGARFRLEKSEADSLRRTMMEKRDDREKKGHYRAPCAGSAFKNNRKFAAPSGRIIDDCGLKGYAVGQAAVSDWHANIPINLGGARADDMKQLLDGVAVEVERQRGFRLEPELQFAGEWDSTPKNSYGS